MKKTIGIIVSLLICLIMLTGCVNINYEVKVNKDGSGDISYVYAFSKETLESLKVSVDEMIASSKEQAEKNGYKTESYEDKENLGFKATKHIGSLETEFSLQDAFGDEYVKDNENNSIKVKKDLFKTEITQNAEIDLTSMSEIATLVKMKYTVKLPVSIKSNNATKVDGQSLTWELKGGEVNKIEYTAVGINVMTILGIVLVVAAVIAIVVVGCIFMKKNKKEKVVKEETNK